AVFGTRWLSYDISTVSTPLYPSLPIVFETVMPPDRFPGSFSTMKQVMPSGVLAASATTLDRSPLVTHVLVPSMTYSSPSGVALHRRDRVSLPASGSLRLRAPRHSPAAILGRIRCF